MIRDKESVMGKTVDNFSVTQVNLYDYARDCVAAAKASGIDPEELANNYIRLAAWILAVVNENKGDLT